MKNGMKVGESCLIVFEKILPSHTGGRDFFSMSTPHHSSVRRFWSCVTFAPSINISPHAGACCLDPWDPASDIHTPVVLFPKSVLSKHGIPCLNSIRTANFPSAAPGLHNMAKIVHWVYIAMYYNIPCHIFMNHSFQSNKLCCKCRLINAGIHFDLCLEKAMKPICNISQWTGAFWISCSLASVVNVLSQ